MKKAVGFFALAMGAAILMVIIAIFSGSWPSNAQAESPSPQPYPGSSPIKTYSYMYTRFGALEYDGTYTLDLTTDTLQRYYSGQMARYCIDAWQFVPFDASSQYTEAQRRAIAGSDGHVSGVTAQCGIQHPHGQSFRVRLYPMTAGQTKVDYQVRVVTDCSPPFSC